MSNKINIRTILTTLALIIIFYGSPTAFGKIIYVDDDAFGNNDGSSWENAYIYLQDALADADDSEKPVEVHVAQGIYKPNTVPFGRDVREVTFRLRNDVSLIGGFAGLGISTSSIAVEDPNARDIEVYKTILSGDLDGDDVDVNSPEGLSYESTRKENCYHVVTGSGTNETAVLDGFIITGGNANGPMGRGTDTLLRQGGGLYNHHGSPTVLNCTFTGNYASDEGGGVYNSTSNPRFFNCKFVMNYANDKGGAIYNLHSETNLINCIFTRNYAQEGGGGIYNDQSNPTMTNCMIRTSFAEDGAGIYNSWSYPNFLNCIFVGNYAVEYGGGIFNENSDPVFTNCTFTGNRAENGNAIACRGFGHAVGKSDVEMVNCIVWDSDAIWIGDNSEINATYSNFKGSWPGEGNIDEDPLFTNPLGFDNVSGTEDDDLRLDSSSPCIDLGDPDYIAEPNETDFRGNPRIAGGRIDMGAYEFQGVIYVDDDAAGANDGSSWEDAFIYLQDALSVVKDGKEIRVAQGTYTPDLGGGNTAGDTSATFQLIDGVTIRGGFVGLDLTSSSEPLDPNTRDVEIFETILSGVLNDDVDPNSLSVFDYSATVVTGSNTDETAVLDGFTITGGSGFSFEGAGIHIESGSPTIMNCSLIGSGFSLPYNLHSEFSNENGSSPTITNCIISNSSSGDGAMQNKDSSPVLVDCIFKNNLRGMENRDSNLVLINCVFQGHSDKAIEQNDGSLTLEGCSFIDNSCSSAAGTSSSGGISNSGGDLIIRDCIFTGNSYESSFGSRMLSKGGAISNFEGSLILTDCIFTDNSSKASGGGVHSYLGSVSFNNCDFINNSADDEGGAIAGSNMTLRNCRFIGNSADEGGALEISNSDIQNCTFYGNNRDSVIYKRGGTLDLSNCIIWNNNSNIISGDDINITYSNIQGGWPGVGNIDLEPWFVDPLGPDYIFGTGDEDLRLSPLSPCIDSGDPDYIAMLGETDLDGNTRVFSGRIDMGAYEYQGIIYVDDDAPNVEWPMYVDLAYSFELGTKDRPFDSIQEAIDLAKDEYTILVQPGVYEKINFLGKAITVAGIEGAAVIEASPNNGSDSLELDAVTFHTGEGPDSILKNFIIRNSALAISLNYGSSPTIQNLTIVDNEFGIAAYEDSNPDIKNCIFWNNRDGDLFQCAARYSCMEDKIQGQGNIYINPLFVDAANGDYHLKSEGWRWNDVGQSWTWDEVTSRCIDAGDPCSPLGNEPLRIPRDPNNEFGINLRINMGAYGGTSQASMPPLNFSIPEDDNTPPSPNPAQWVLAPLEIYGMDGISDSRIEMEAMEATDDSGIVEYYFECTTDSDFSSGWISDNKYSFLINQSGQGLRFRVKARDLFYNETEWSDEQTVQEPIIL